MHCCHVMLANFLEFIRNPSTKFLIGILKKKFITFHKNRGTFSVPVIAIRNGILKETVCVSLCTNVYEKGINPSFFPSHE